MHRVSITLCLTLLLGAPAFGGAAEDLEALISPDALATGDYDAAMDAAAGVIERNAKDGGPLVLLAVKRLNAWREYAKDPDRVTDRLAAVLAAGVADGDSDEALRYYVWNRRRERGEIAAAAALDPSRGFLRHWAVVGPFGADTAAELFRRFPPEAGIDFEAVCRDAGQERRYRMLPLTDGTWIEPFDILRPTDGTAYAVCQVKSEEDRSACLQIGSAGSCRVWLNGEEILTADRLRDRLPRVLRPTASLRAGWNRFVVKLAGDGNRFTMKLVSQDTGRPLPGITEEADLVLHPHAGAGTAGATDTAPAPEDRLPAVPDAPALELAARAILLADDGFALEAVEAMEQSVAAAPDDPAIRLLLGARLEQARDLPDVHRKNRARAEYETVLEQVPGYAPAAVRLANLHHADDRSEKGAEILRSLLAENPDCVEAHQALSSICSARNWEKEAIDEAKAVLALAPSNRVALHFLAGVNERYGDVPEARKLLERIVAAYRDDYDSLRRLARMDLKAGDPDSALGRYRRISEFWPRYTGSQVNIAGILLDQGATDQALSILEAVAARYPLDPGYPDRIGDLRRRTGDAGAAIASYEKSLALGPWQSPLRRYVARLKDEPVDFSLPWEVDALALIEGAPGRDDYPRAPAVCLLDSQVSRFWPDGSSTDVTHQCYKLLDEKGVEAFGRVNTGGEALEVRTIDAEGRIFEPLGVRRGTYNMPALAPGVVVDYRYRTDTRRNPRGLDTQEFFFADPEFDNAVLLSRWVIILPKSLKVDLILRNFDGKHEITEDGDTVVHVLEVTNQPRTERENFMPENSELLPWARLVRNRPFRDLSFLYADRLWGGLSPTPPVAREAARATENVEGNLERARRVFTHVNEIITGSGSFGGPTATLVQKSGDRFGLFVSMLVAAGVEFEPAIAATNHGRDLEWEIVDTSMFRARCLRIPGADGEVAWAFPGGRFAAFGRIPDRYLDSPVLVLSPEGGRLETLPSEREEDHQNRTKTRIALSADGTPRGSVRFEATTDGGYSMKERLRNSDADDRRQTVEGMVSSIFTGPKLTSWEAPGLEELGARPVIEAEVELPNFLRAEAQDGGVSCGLALNALNLQGRYAGKSERIHPMVIESDHGQRDEVVIDLQGRAVTSLPEDHVTVGPLGTYSLTVRRSGDEIRVVRSLRFRPVTLSPAEYRDFVDWMKGIDEAELRRIRLAP